MFWGAAVSLDAALLSYSESVCRAGEGKRKGKGKGKGKEGEQGLRVGGDVGETTNGILHKITGPDRTAITICTEPLKESSEGHLIQYLSAFRDALHVQDNKARI